MAARNVRYNPVQPQTFRERVGEFTIKTGTAQIVCGAISFIMGISTLIFVKIFAGQKKNSDADGPEWTYIFAILGAPVWCGALYIVSGILGRVSGWAQQHDNSLITPYLVLSIVSICFAVVQAVTEGLATHHACQYNTCEDNSEKIESGLHGISTFVAAVEIIAALLGCVFCCVGNKCECIIPPYADREDNTHHRNTGLAQIALGITSMFLGACIVVLTVTEFVNSSWLFGQSSGIISWPIWGGAIYIASGTLGVSHLIVPYLVMSIMSCISAFGQVIWEGFAANSNACMDMTVIVDPSANISCNALSEAASEGLHGTMSVIGLMELIAAFIAAIFCCQAMGCQSRCWPKYNPLNGTNGSQPLQVIPLTSAQPTAPATGPTTTQVALPTSTTTTQSSTSSASGANQTTDTASSVAQAGSATASSGYLTRGSLSSAWSGGIPVGRVPPTRQAARIPEEMGDELVKCTELLMTFTQHLVPVIIEYIRAATFSRDHQYDLDEFAEFYRCKNPSECSKVKGVDGTTMVRCDKCVKWADLTTSVLYPDEMLGDKGLGKIDTLTRYRGDGFFDLPTASVTSDDDIVTVLSVLQDLQLDRDELILDRKSWLPEIKPQIKKILEYWNIVKSGESSSQQLPVRTIFNDTRKASNDLAKLYKCFVHYGDVPQKLRVINESPVTDEMKERVQMIRENLLKEKESECYDQVSKFIGSEGGSLSITDGDLTIARLQIPPGALRRDHKIKLSIVSPERDHPPQLDNRFIIAPIVRLEPDGLKFERPVTLTVRHAAVDLTQTNLEVWTKTASSEVTEWQLTYSGQTNLNNSENTHLKKNEVEIRFSHFCLKCFVGFCDLKVWIFPYVPAHLSGLNEVAMMVYALPDYYDRKVIDNELFPLNYVLCLDEAKKEYHVNRHNALEIDFKKLQDRRGSDVWRIVDRPLHIRSEDLNKAPGNSCCRFVLIPDESANHVDSVNATLTVQSNDRSQHAMEVYIRHPPLGLSGPEGGLNSPQPPDDTDRPKNEPIASASLHSSSKHYPHAKKSAAAPIYQPGSPSSLPPPPSIRVVEQNPHAFAATVANQPHAISAAPVYQPGSPSTSFPPPSDPQLEFLRLYKGNERGNLTNPFLEKVAREIQPRWRVVAARLAVSEDICDNIEAGADVPGVPWRAAFIMLDNVRERMSDNEARSGRQIIADAVKPDSDELYDRLIN